MKSVNLYRRMWKISIKYYKNAYLHLTMMTILGVLSTFLATSIPFLMKTMIDETQLNHLSTDIDNIFTLKNLYSLVVIYSFVWLFSKILEWIQNIASLYLSNSFEVSLLDFALKDFLNIKKSEIDKIDIGNFISDINRASTAFSATNTTIFLILIPTLTQTFFMCWYIYKNTNGLYTIFFIFFSILLFIFSQYINNKNKKYLVPVYLSRNKVNSFFMQKALNSYDIKTNNAIEYETKKFRKILEENVKTSFYNQTKVGLSLIIQIIIIFIFLLTFMTVSAYFFRKNIISSGVFILISSYIVMLTTPFLMLSQQLSKLGANIIALSRFQFYLDMNKDQLSQEKISNMDYSYKFEDAVLKLGEKLVAKFNFEFIENRKYAIVGETGIGKTTFVNHLLGLDKIEKGKLLYKNIDITQNFSSYIFDEIAFVGQKNVLYNGNLRDNITYNINYKYKDEEIIYFFKEMYLESTFSNYNIDLDSPIDEVYKKFSGGECQRLNIIRALLKKPNLLILDEPTSALDEKTSKKILSFMESKVKSIIVVTHSENCISWADHIIDLNEILKNKL